MACRIARRGGPLKVGGFGTDCLEYVWLAARVRRLLGLGLAALYFRARDGVRTRDLIYTTSYRVISNPQIFDFVNNFQSNNQMAKWQMANW